MDLICGIHPVLEALSAGKRHFDRLLIVKGIRNARISETVARASQLGIPLRFESREALDRLAGETPHQGIIAVVSAKPAITLPELLDDVRNPPLLVLLDGVEDPRNLGAILRTAEAAGADGVLLPERRSAGLSETVARASAGALEHVRVARIGNVVQTLQELKARGFWIVGFDAAGKERWDGVDYRRPLVLVLGGEGRGIRRLVQEACDHLVSLPLFGQVASLNVSVAAGIALYEAIRQRGSVPSQVRPIRDHAPSIGTAVLAAEAEGREGERPPAGVEDIEAADSEEPEDRPRHGLMDIEDEAAWSGPVLLKARPRHHHGRRWGRARRASTERRATSAPSPPAPRAPGPGPGAPDVGPSRLPSDRAHPRRRRRRRRGGDRPSPPGQGPAQGIPPSAAGSTPPPGVGHDARPPGPGPEPRPPKRRRHRRRRGR